MNPNFLNKLSEIGKQNINLIVIDDVYGLNIFEIYEDYKEFKLIKKVSYQILKNINNPFIEYI